MARRVKYARTLWLLPANLSSLGHYLFDCSRNYLRYPLRKLIYKFRLVARSLALFLAPSLLVALSRSFGFNKSFDLKHFAPLPSFACIHIRYSIRFVAYEKLCPFPGFNVIRFNTTFLFVLHKVCIRNYSDERQHHLVLVPAAVHVSLLPAHSSSLCHLHAHFLSPVTRYEMAYRSRSSFTYIWDICSSN